MTQTVRAGINPRADRVASSVILCILAAIGIAVYLRGRQAPVEEAVAPAGSVVSPLEPAARLLGRYALTGTRVYNADNLYEYINGEAPRYIQFGFKAVTVADYEADSAAAPLVVDMYDMGGRRNAYGIFADSRPVEEPSIPLGSEGYASGNVAAFWKGPFYVRVAALTDEDLGARVLEAAREAAAWIKCEAGPLREFSAFPTENLVENSMSYQKSGAFGLEHLNDTFVARYLADGQAYQLFFSDPGSRERAAEVLRLHAKFLQDNGTLEESLHRADEDLLWGTEPYLGPCLLTARGEVLAGCLGLADRARAEALVRQVLSRAGETLGRAQEGDIHGAR